MTFQDAKELAIEFGAKLPKFDHTSPVAQCWIDRIEWLSFTPKAEAKNIEYFINEANRYAS